MKFAALLITIASLHTHGYSGDTVPLPELEAQMARGQTIVASCGTVEKLGVRAVLAAGGRAREVGTLTRDPWNGEDDGHMLMELWTKRGWTLFDLDTNRRAPWGIGIGEQVAAGHDRKWITIAHDPLYAESEADVWPATRAVFADLPAWYDHIFGIAGYYDPARGYLFHDAAMRARAESYGWVWTDKATWRRLTR